MDKEQSDNQVSKPREQRSRVSPDKAWADGNPAIVSDADVDAWLRRNAPETARDVRREDRTVQDQQKAELQLGPTYNNAINAAAVFGWSGHSGSGFEVIGTPVCQFIKDDDHWVFTLFPGFGRREICDLVCPILPTLKEATIFRLHLDEQQTGPEIAAVFGLRPNTVFTYLAQIRKFLLALASENLLPCDPAEKTALELDEIESLEMQALVENVRPRPPRQMGGIGVASGMGRKPTRAYVCACGHHFRAGHDDLDHRRLDKSLTCITGGGLPERQLRCPHCKRVYPESQWPDLAA